MSTTTDSCAICRNPLNNGQRTESPGECNHIFHEACIDNLVTYAKDGSNIPCPLCRKNLVPPHMTGSEYKLGILGILGGKRTLKAKGKRSLRKTKRKRKTKTKRKTKSKSRKTGVKRKKY